MNFELTNYPGGTGADCYGEKLWFRAYPVQEGVYYAYMAAYGDLRRYVGRYRTLREACAGLRKARAEYMAKLSKPCPHSPQGTA